jgi:capsular polysaccharide biosynthesis protein
LPKHVALSNPEKPKSLISAFFEDPRFDNEVILTSFKSGLSYGTYIIKLKHLPKHVALSNPEKPKSPISAFFEDPRFDNEVILTSFKSGLSYGTFLRLQKYIYFQFLQLYFLLIVLFHEKSL